jgi:hydrogenase expression/formation protein HypD
LLPENVSLLSGPGCPVCVTPNTYVDKAIAIARQPDTIITTFGDMVRVPGSESSLERERARGANIRIVYSPMDALELARKTPGKKIIFLGVGFETTAPTIAWTIRQAAQENLTNFAVLCAHKTIPNAMAALIGDPLLAIDGFMCPGHVSIVTGAKIYEFICRDYHRPCVVAGFEPGDMAAALAMLTRQLSEDRAEVEVQYDRSVNHEGNAAAQAILAEVFTPTDADWRGVGVIPGSGLAIKPEFAAHDADKLFPNLELPTPKEHKGCRCGDVLRGICTPRECPLFKNACTPETPIGACMVSSEGTCAAYYKYDTLNHE